MICAAAIPAALFLMRRKKMHATHRKFLIKKDERGLLFRKGDFVTVLHAGEHRYFDPFMRLTVEKYPLAKTAFERAAEKLPIKTKVVARLGETLVEEDK